MKWRKLGKIFDPTEYELPNGCVEFAQSPQALVFDDFVRIYFSTRAVDPENGKYLSHIAFVDMDLTLRNVIRVADKQVIPLGELGAFDEHGIFPMSVMRHGDTILGYTCGWNRRVSVSVDTAIGMAVSYDEGLTFQRQGPGPVLAASLHEPFLVGDGYVRLVGETFYMWYIFGTSWKSYSPNSAPDRIYKIGQATSRDGTRWVKQDGCAIVPDRLGEDESQALPTVIEIEGRHHMFFCYRQSFDFRKNPSRGYRIGHAVSDDLMRWSRDDEMPALEVSEGAWDSDMMCYPNVFECRGEIYLLYNGNQFGRYGFGLAVLEK